MKKLFYTAPLLLMIGIVASCKKHINHTSQQIVIDTTIASTTQFALDLKPYGDADDVATITQQATSYSTSEISNTAGTFAPVYHYAAAAKTTGTDKVVISITEGPDRNGNPRRHSDSTTVTINFTIH
jgi:hypothetical protein